MQPRERCSVASDPESDGRHTSRETRSIGFPTVRLAYFAQPLDGQCKDRWLAIRSEAHVEPAEHLELSYRSLRVRMVGRTFRGDSRRAMGAEHTVV